MQSVSSRIWARVAVSISYDDNHYTTGTSDIWPIGKTLSGATTLGVCVNLRAMAMKGYFTFFISPRLEPRYQIVLCRYQESRFFKGWVS